MNTKPQESNTEANKAAFENKAGEFASPFPSLGNAEISTLVVGGAGTGEPLCRKDIEPLVHRIAALELSLSSLQTQTALIEQGVIQALNAK